MRKIILIIILLAIPVVSFAQDAITQATPQYEQQPAWYKKFPAPYTDESNKILLENSYKEKWDKCSLRKYPEAVEKAKKVLGEWGQDPDKYEYKSSYYDYEIWVYESLNFISITFYPIELDITSQEVEIRMTKDSLEVLSILKGS